MSPTSTIAEQSQAAALTPERFLEQLWGIRPGHRSPRVTSVEPATGSEPRGEGVALWLYRMWGIESLRRDRQAA